MFSQQGTQRKFGKSVKELTEFSYVCENIFHLTFDAWNVFPQRTGIFTITVDSCIKGILISVAVERAGQAVHITGEPLASGTDTATIVHFCAAVGVDVTVVIVKLYQLKEEGMEFPGRMRDHVAEACKVSRSKLARLKVIRENLIPELDELNKQDKLPESVAYVLAKMEPEDQKDVYQKIFTKACYAVTESRVIEYGKFSKDLRQRRCAINKGSCCTNRDAMANKWVNENSWTYHNCKHVTCCSECSELGSCKSACPMLGDKIKKIKADKREARRQKKAAQEAKEYPDKVMIRELWYRFGYARQRARMSVKQVCEAGSQFYYPDLKKRYEEHENDDVAVTVNEMLAANFTRGDLIVTFTYDDDHLPGSRRQAEGKLKYFRAKLAAARRQRGEELRMIWCTEHRHGDGRWHHHAAINATGDDYEEILRLWAQGEVEITKLRADKEKNYESLARYMAKEELEKLGQRAWSYTRSCRKPQVEVMRVEADTPLNPPKGALMLRGMIVGMRYVDALLKGAYTEPSGWAVDELEEAVAAGITDGTRPRGYATREEAAIMVKRATVDGK